MYLVQNTKSQRDKIVSGLITSVLLFVTFALLRWAALPEARTRSRVYDEINWEKFTPKPEKIADQPKPVKVEKPPQIQKPAETPGPVEKIDLSSLESLSLPTLTKSAPDLQQTVSKKPEAASDQQARIDPGSTELLAGFNTMLGEDRRRLSVSHKGAGGERNGPALTAQSGASLGQNKAKNYGGASFSLGAPEAKRADGNTTQVSLMDMANMGADFADLSPIYRALVEWMKRHPGTFPDVVQRFMEQSHGDLTSRIDFRIDGRHFQMFLLCKPKIYEIRICLIEGSQSTYLIDRGFKENSSFLRTGSVSLKSDGALLSFGTAREAASSQKTTEFYRIFLSWWESVKPEVQQFL